MTTSSRNISRSLMVLLALVAATNAFQPLSQSTLLQQKQQQKYSTSSTGLFMAKKTSGKTKKTKGFGETPVGTPKKVTPSSNEPFTAPLATTPEPSQKYNTGEGSPGQSNLSSPTIQSSVMTEDRPGTTRESDMNMGQKALAAMRREKAEEKDAELRRVREIRDTDKMLQTVPDAAAIPEKVAMRMGKRMLPFVGIPLFGSMGAFIAFWYFATYKGVEFEPSAVAAATILILVSGLVGITYSIISASWDDDREGSALGLDEFKKNIGNIQDGLSRSKENLVLREKMAGLPESEIASAIDALDRREKKGQSFQRKMGDEMDK